MFTIAEAGAVVFTTASFVQQPDEGYGETVIARRSRQSNVTRSLPAGEWDVIVRVYDVLSSVSVAHTTINVQLAEAVTADVTQGVIDEGLDALQSADPSEGLNSILVVFSTLNDANQSAVSAGDQTEQTTEAAVALFEEVRARLVRRAGPVRAPSVRGRVATRAAGGRRPGKVCGRRRDRRADDADLLGGARHHGDDVRRDGRRDHRGAR